MELESNLTAPEVTSPGAYKAKQPAVKSYVSNEDESLRLFQSDFLEKLTKVHPITPVLIFTPVVIFLIWEAYKVFHLNLVSISGLFVGGALFWTIFEYTLHRYVFHFEPEEGFFKKVHFLFHGIHHAYPRDSRRLVMPPSVSIPLSAAIYFLCTLIFPTRTLPGFFAGFLFGYLCYDMIHFGIHNLNFKNKAWMAIRNHHYRHHYNDKTRGFGVSSPLWDLIFKS
jgi:sterol desaturase/sphingolipid hydroxylase (fatty acid hydroxylase superfamily)